MVVLRVRLPNPVQIVQGKGAVMEVEDAAMDMLDLIVATWVFFEQRRDRRMW